MYSCDVKTTPEFLFFYGSASAFSNWFPCTFTIDNVTYSSSEQYMMHQKALFFNDVETADAIMKTNAPWVQKVLGRSVRGFNRLKWTAVCKDIVVKGLVAKFDQNKDIKNILLETGGRIIVEASAFDRIWGIGLCIDDPKITDTSAWRGSNLLGISLMETRDILK